MAPVAVQQGQYLAEALKTWHAGGEPEPFVYEDPGMMAVVGRSHAVVQAFGMAITGFVAWVMWALVHVAKLVGFRNRMLVLVNWAWNYVFYERAVRLILPVEKERLKSIPGGYKDGPPNEQPGVEDKPGMAEESDGREAGSGTATD